MGLLIDLTRAADAVSETTSSSSDPEVATIGEALSYAGFTIAIVFGVLLLIFICIRIFTAIFSVAEKAGSAAEPAIAAETAAASAVEAASEGEDFSSGTLRLKGCDEKTAAMIMAIVSDNTGIPLSELVFKSITLVENE